ncbi:MAG: bifunctional riboflavin kinase/FAD synthetase [Bacteroidaceae bacterium]|nr:bifunctional riboflavin kinase/FAD synthetase [Bacteroidaceae bacterium]
MQPSPLTPHAQTTPLLQREGAGGGSAIATIGFFDGVHCGHLCLIRQLLEEARQRHAWSLLITFDRHPRSIFAPDTVPSLLTTTQEKLALLRATGVDDIHVLHFDHAMANLTASQFMRHVLHDQLHVQTLVIGYDHHFGRPQGERFEDYKAIGLRMGIDVVLARAYDGQHISSSAIRRALNVGDVGTANLLLGRPYTWTGNVVHGHGIGRQLGFPTANLQAITPDKILPAAGVYAVEVTGLDMPRAAMLNIGRRPTLDNGQDITVEAHLFDYDEDLYGRNLTLSFIARLRDEHCFDSEADLVRQLQEDKRRILSLFKT